MTTFMIYFSFFCKLPCYSCSLNWIILCKFHFKKSFKCTHISPVAFIFHFWKSHIILHLNRWQRSVPLLTLSYIIYWSEESDIFKQNEDNLFVAWKELNVCGAWWIYQTKNSCRLEILLFNVKAQLWIFSDEMRLSALKVSLWPGLYYFWYPSLKLVCSILLHMGAKARMK